MIELHRAALDLPFLGPLKPVDLTAGPGEKITLSSPGDCGSRALLSLMTGVCAPSEGMVRFTSDGLEMTETERKSALRLIPPGGGLWGNMTVWENLMTVCRLYGQSGRAAEISCERAVDACGLEKAEDIRWGKLPPDWQIRTAVAAAFACGADTVGAAALTRDLKINESRRIAELMGRVFSPETTVIVCEDNMSLSQHFGTRHLLLREGRILFDGTEEEMLRAARRGDYVSAARALFREAS